MKTTSDFIYGSVHISCLELESVNLTQFVLLKIPKSRLITPFVLSRELVLGFFKARLIIFLPGFLIAQNCIGSAYRSEMKLPTSGGVIAANFLLFLLLVTTSVFRRHAKSCTAWNVVVEGFFLWFHESFRLLLLPCFFSICTNVHCWSGSSINRPFFYLVGLLHWAAVQELGAVCYPYLQWYPCRPTLAVLLRPHFSFCKTPTPVAARPVELEKHHLLIWCLKTQSVLGSNFPMPGNASW